MTILQSLDRYYDRMAARGDAEESGFTKQNVSFALSIALDGSILDVIDLRQNFGRKLLPQRMSVPRPKRTSDIKSNFLWDKTAYAFGIDGGKSKRLEKEHECFRSFHHELLDATDCIQAKAMLAFVDRWKPEYFLEPLFKSEMVDASFVFRLENEREFIHQHPLLRETWVKSLEEAGATQIFCLASGKAGPLETGHPIIKGVEGAQVAGAYLVSFNASAYTSYNRPTDASNAPVSKEAAARYAAALNGLLERSSPNRLPRPIGDASVVFWADASGVGETAAKAAEDWFSAMFVPSPDDEGETAKLRDALAKVAAGRPLPEIDPRLSEGVRFHVLGLSPNVSRLSVRYWLDDRFEVFARRLADHAADLAIDPPPWRTSMPSVYRLLAETTARAKEPQNIPSNLAGEVTRAILNGTPYPRTLLATVIIRLRADDDLTGWHAAAIRAVLAREHRLKHLQKDIPPVSLDRDNAHPAYQLGRMFATLETAQRMALGRVNATIRDRYFGAASATPASVFPLLLRGAQSHLGKLRKEGKGGWIEREIEEIADHLPTELPRSLRLEAQGRFVIGYYHQRRAQFAGVPADEVAEIENATAKDDENEF